MNDATLAALDVQLVSLAIAGKAHSAPGRCAFLVDAVARQARHVLATYNVPLNDRFFVVDAAGSQEAIDVGVAARAAGCRSIADYRAKVAFAVRA